MVEVKERQFNILNCDRKSCDFQHFARWVIKYSKGVLGQGSSAGDWMELIL